MSQGRHDRWTDSEAIKRSVAEPETFVTVFERHFSAVHRYFRVRAGDVEADDLAAQTFEIAFRRRAVYDRSRADAHPWLFGIATNLLREHRRKRRRSAGALRRLVERGVSPDGVARDGFPQDDAAPLRAALERVREEDRDLLLLHVCVELTYEECAAALGIPVGTVRSRLHRLRERLRGELEDTVSLGLEEPR